MRATETLMKLRVALAALGFTGCSWSSGCVCATTAAILLRMAGSAGVQPRRRVNTAAKLEADFPSGADWFPVKL